MLCSDHRPERTGSSPHPLEPSPPPRYSAGRQFLGYRQTSLDPTILKAKMLRKIALFFSCLLIGSLSSHAQEVYKPATTISIAPGAWHSNGKPTYAGTRAEGLLLNMRAVNAVFEDRNALTAPKGFDPEKNTQAFIDKVPEYVACGVRAFTIGLQGGDPGYAGALNSAYEPDGRLRPGSVKRVERAIEACDRAGAAVILCCFDHGQDQVLKDAAAVKKAVAGTVEWLRGRGYRNILLEIAGEFMHKNYDHAAIRDPNGMKELVLLAKKTWPQLLVSASGMGGGRLDHRVGTDADFLLLHFENVPVEEILERVASADKVSKPIVCNHDQKTGEEGAKALEATVNALASWGYSNVKNQHHPFLFAGAADDPAVYAKFKELTSK